MYIHTDRVHIHTHSQDVRSHSIDFYWEWKSLLYITLLYLLSPFCSFCLHPDACRFIVQTKWEREDEYTRNDKDHCEKMQNKSPTSQKQSKTAMNGELKDNERGCIWKAVGLILCIEMLELLLVPWHEGSHEYDPHEHTEKKKTWRKKYQKHE